MNNLEETSKFLEKAFRNQALADKQSQITNTNLAEELAQAKKELDILLRDPKNRLDGYRELGQKCAELENVADILRAENSELRKLLWLNHGHKDLYENCKEQWCRTCTLDFRFAPVNTIKDMIKQSESPVHACGADMICPICKGPCEND